MDIMKASLTKNNRILQVTTYWWHGVNNSFSKYLFALISETIKKVFKQVIKRSIN